MILNIFYSAPLHSIVFHWTKLIIMDKTISIRTKLFQFNFKTIIVIVQFFLLSDSVLFFSPTLQLTQTQALTVNSRDKLNYKLTSHSPPNSIRKRCRRNWRIRRRNKVSILHVNSTFPTNFNQITFHKTPLNFSFSAIYKLLVSMTEFHSVNIASYWYVGYKRNKAMVC
jgi:hypothetical protein